jgi:hypothetical protein
MGVLIHVERAVKGQVKLFVKARGFRGLTAPSGAPPRPDGSKRLEPQRKMAFYETANDTDFEKIRAVPARKEGDRPGRESTPEPVWQIEHSQPNSPRMVIVR